MRQRADRNACDLHEVGGAEYLDDVLGADRHIGELAGLSAGDVDVVGDRAGVERLQDRERWLGIEHHDLADVLQRQPDLLAVGRRGDVGAERARLLDATDDLLRGGVDHHGLWCEARTDVTVFSVRRENRHAGAVGDGDARGRREGLAVEHLDIILAAHRDPDFATVGAEKRLMRRAPDIGRVLHGIGRGIDERHRVRTDRDRRQRLTIGREAHAVDKQLPLVERAEVGGGLVAELDDAEQRIG